MTLSQWVTSSLVWCSTFSTMSSLSSLSPPWARHKVKSPLWSESVLSDANHASDVQTYGSSSDMITKCASCCFNNSWGHTLYRCRTTQRLLLWGDWHCDNEPSDKKAGDWMLVVSLHTKVRLEQRWCSPVIGTVTTTPHTGNILGTEIITIASLVINYHHIQSSLHHTFIIMHHFIIMRNIFSPCSS